MKERKNERKKERKKERRTYLFFKNSFPLILWESIEK